MSTELIVYVLTALAAVVVVLTRLRLGRSEGARRIDVGRRLLGVHTVRRGARAGGLAALPLRRGRARDNASTLVGIVALAFWWIVVGAGLLILVRWLPSHGKHAAEATQDSWSEGPGLSILAHVGMLVGVIVFTWAYLDRPVPSLMRRLGTVLVALGAGGGGSAGVPRAAEASEPGDERGDRHADDRPLRRRSPDHGLPPRPRAGRADRGAVLHHARRRAGHPPDPPDAPRRPADPRRRPLGGADVQPRRAGPRHPQERPRRRPQPQLPLRLGGPRRRLRVRSPTEVRAGDPRGDALPAATSGPTTS